MPLNWNFFVVALLAGLKFQLAFPWAVSAGMGFAETFIATMLGGTSGVLFFAFLSDHLMRWVNRIRRVRASKPKKRFSRFSRFLVRFVRRFGLPGIAFITPLILSIPLGTFLCSRINDKFVRNRNRMLGFLFASVAFWSLAFPGIGKFFAYVHQLIF